MDVFAKQIPIPQLIAQLDNYMVETGYAESTMSNFREFWRALSNHAQRDGFIYLTKENGFQVLKNHYNIDPYELKLGVYHTSMRRALMLLLEYQVSGCIAGSIQRSGYAIPKEHEELCEQFFEYLRQERMLRERTIGVYRRCLSKALSFFAGHGITNLSTIGTSEMETYLLTMAGLSKAYINGNLTVLKRFFEFLSTRDSTATPIVFPAVPYYKDRKIPEYYTAEEVHRILAAVDRSNPTGKRNYAMILLAARYGLRIGDIRELKFSEVDFSNNTISIVQSKTGRPLTHTLLPDVGWALIDYLKHGRPQSSSPCIFVRHTVPYKELGSNDNMIQVIQKYANAAGIMKSSTHKRCSFHMLRYSLATELLEKNVSLSTISGILGHSELNITAKYTQLNTNQLKECALEVPL